LSARRDRREVYGRVAAADSGDIAIYRGKSDMRWRAAGAAVPPFCRDEREKRRWYSRGDSPVSRRNSRRNVERSL
jgi:hypothetical protein